MSLLYRIIYAAHANGTHHKLALDALLKLRHPEAEAWRNVVLKHVAVYLEGSKDPDNKFKDFKNHVLHVKDGYWGGAPEKVQSWYGHVVAALRAGNWSEAVYAAGVLSHYYTDPVHPFHTGQTTAENNVHRAAEWSINRAYDSLVAEHKAQVSVPMPAGPDWLREMTCNAADASHRYYEALIAHYDINRGVVDPPAGLDAVSRRFVAELIAYASSGFALILDRALIESSQNPPDVSLTLDTVVAALQIPVKTLQKRLSNGIDRDLVQRIYDELRTTGKVEINLPEDDRQVRDLHAREVLAPRAAEQTAARAARLQPTPAPAPRQRMNGIAPPPAIALGPNDTKPNTAQRIEQPTTPQPPAEPVSRGLEHEIPWTPAEDVQPVVQFTPTSASKRSPRFYLAPGDDLEAAPSIGAKTAQRFALIGVKTVADFLEYEPVELTESIGQRALTFAVIADWQAQARLVMSVPGLRGTHAQLLVGAGYRDAAAIIAADADKLCADVLSFATTSAGQRALRDGAAPDIEKIRAWIADATAYAEAA